MIFGQLLASLTSGLRPAVSYLVHLLFEHSLYQVFWEWWKPSGKKYVLWGVLHKLELQVIHDKEFVLLKFSGKSLLSIDGLEQEHP